MTYVSRQIVDVTTATGGGVTAYTGNVNGRLASVIYVKDGTAPLASTADFTLTAEGTGEAILAVTNINATATWRPRAATHDVVGAASLYAAGGEPVEGLIDMASDRVKIVVAQGGNTKVGRFHVTFI